MSNAMPISFFVLSIKTRTKNTNTTHKSTNTTNYNALPNHTVERVTLIVQKKEHNANANKTTNNKSEYSNNNKNKYKFHN